MTDDQFGQLADLIGKLLTLGEQQCSALGETNYHLRQLTANTAPPGSGATLAEDEEEGKAQLYAVRRKQDGELALMFYAAAPLVQQPTGKLYFENFSILAPHCQVDLSEPCWTGRDTPSKEALEQMPDGYLRPLGGTLHFVKKERPAKNGGFASKPIVRIIGFTPDPAATFGERSTTALPTQTAPPPAPPTPPPAQTAPSPSPAAPPPATPQTTQTAQQLRQAISATLQLSNPTDITRACNYLAQRWATLQSPPAPIKSPGEPFQSLTPEQLTAFRQHFLAYPTRWRATWQSAQFQ